MTVYSTDLTGLLNTIKDTLGHRVAPALPDGTARQELAAVLEQLDNLTQRVAWDQARLAQDCARTEELAMRLGLAPAADSSADVDTLRTRRREISELLHEAYRDGAPRAGLVDSVLEFSGTDVAEQISVGLRAGLPI
ncbi:hypothetical protein [Nocardia shimofusensis]|uniref:hypothetical protein n=1 Tax=Nocardia shimofusensis TaxID=228596 RepID=UPI0008324932|nr:hypothetical protein [Nocardia shimofusensis]